MSLYATLTSAVQYIMDEWQLKTKLKLEKAVYDRMIIRDVNNYIAIYDDGTLKTKGAYSHDFVTVIPNFGSYKTEYLERLLPYAPLSANLSIAFSGVPFLNDVLSFFIVYDRMIIRDVNNYIAIYDDGTLKTKGAYSHDLQLHQNFSGLVIAKVAQEVNLNIVDCVIRLTS
jgi:hypothetical protein